MRYGNALWQEAFRISDRGESVRIAVCARFVGLVPDCVLFVLRATKVVCLRNYWMKRRCWSLHASGGGDRHLSTARSEPLQQFLHNTCVFVFLISQTAVGSQSRHFDLVCKFLTRLSRLKTMVPVAELECLVR